jgi:guanylate kinase
MNWIENGRLWEWAEVHGHLYGTISPDPTHDVLLEIDVQGARQIKRRFPSAFLIFVMLPEPWKVVLERRLRGRGTESEESLRRRLSAAGQEIEQGKEQSDHVVINDDLESAVDQVLGIISDVVRTA